MKTPADGAARADDGRALLETLTGACSSVADTRAGVPVPPRAAGHARRLPVQSTKIAPWYYRRARAKVIKAAFALAALAGAGYMAYTVLF
jgi:hypothetical protein